LEHVDIRAPNAAEMSIEQRDETMVAKVMELLGTADSAVVIVGEDHRAGVAQRISEKDLAGSSITASIDPKTVSTGVGLRNRDLRKKEEWFNTDKYPEISFHAKKFEKTDKGFKAMGELTMKGITKPAEIPFTFTGNGSTGVFKGEFTVKREDFNLGKSGGSVGSVVTIHLEVPVKK